MSGHKADKQPVMTTLTDTAPWTMQQTFLGVILTLFPWIAFTLILSSIDKTASITTPLSPQADVIGAIITIIFSAIIEGAFLIAPLYFANAANRSITPRTPQVLYSLGFRHFRLGQTLFWIMVFMSLIVIVNKLYPYLISVLHLNVQTNDQLILQQSKVAPLTTYAILFAAVVIAPFCEEVFFRGFVFPGLRRGLSIGWAIVVSSLLFGVAHADPGSFPVLFVIGITLAILRLRSRSLWPCILLHTFNNGIGALVIILAMQGVIK